jgi:hypothetical protein
VEPLHVLVVKALARSLAYLKIIRVDDAMVKAKFNAQDVAAQVKFEYIIIFSILSDRRGFFYSYIAW